MDKTNKLTLPATILIASIILGGFYYASQVSKQRSIEKQQQIEIENKKQEQLSKELKGQQAKEEAEQALNTCIADTKKDYSNQWHRECKSRGELTSKCIDIRELSFSDYLDKYGLNPITYNQQRGLKNTGEPTDDFLTGLSEDFLTGNSDYLNRRDNECSCRLPLEIADRIIEGLEKDKAECFKKYPQN